MNGGDEGAVGFFEGWGEERERERGEGRLLWFLNISGCGCGYVPCLLGRVRVLCVFFFFFFFFFCGGEIGFDGWMDGWLGWSREGSGGWGMPSPLSLPSESARWLVGWASWFLYFMSPDLTICMYVCIYVHSSASHLTCLCPLSRSLAWYVCMCEWISSFLPSFFWIGQEGASRVLFSFTLFSRLPNLWGLRCLCLEGVIWVLKGFV